MPTPPQQSAGPAAHGREPVGEHHVRGAAGRCHHRRRNPAVLGGKEVVPADAGEVAAQQIADEVMQPVLVRTAVAVGERDDLAFARVDAGVARDREAEVDLTDAAEARARARGSFEFGVSKLETRNYSSALLPSFRIFSTTAMKTSSNE